MTHSKKSDGRQSWWSAPAARLIALALCCFTSGCVLWSAPNPDVPRREGHDPLPALEASGDWESARVEPDPPRSTKAPVCGKAYVIDETLRGLNRLAASRPGCCGGELFSPYFRARERASCRSSGGEGLASLALVFAALAGQAQYGSSGYHQGD